MKSVSMKKVDNINGILAQLGEHLPYKQRVIGSSPIGPIIKENDSFEWFLWRDSSVGQSTRFIPVVSRVRISFPLRNETPGRFCAGCFSFSNNMLAKSGVFLNFKKNDGEWLKKNRF